MCSPSVRPSSLTISDTSSLTSTRCGCSGCRRAKASSRRVRSAPRIEAAERLPTSSRSSGAIALLSSQQIEIADDDAEQIVEIMRHAAGQIADGLHLLRLAQLFLGQSGFR